MTNLLRQHRSQQTRAALLDAAVTLLNSATTAEFTMPAVAANAGKSVGTLYEHFPSKDALLEVVGADYAIRRDVFLTEMLDPGAEGDSSRAERIQRFVRGFIGWYRANRGVLRRLILRTWSEEGLESDESVSAFRANLRRVSRYLCAENWKELSAAQRRAVESSAHYAILLARDALVVDEESRRILKADRGRRLERDLIRIVECFLKEVPE